MIARRQNEVVMLVGFFGINPPATAHAEVKHQRLVAIGVKQAVFGPPREARNRRSCHRLNESGREGAAHIGPVHPDTDDLFAI